MWWEHCGLFPDRDKLCLFCLPWSSFFDLLLFGENEGLTLNGSTASTNRRITGVIFLCAWTHIYYLHQEILYSELNMEAPLLTLVIIYLFPLFFLFKKKGGATSCTHCSTGPRQLFLLNEMQYWQANPPFLHLVDRQLDPMIRLCLPLCHLPHHASSSCIVPFTLPFLAQTQQ